ncbi:hypothetical protein [Chitinophaga ginsengisoli]|uniref:hypothetical protein n=1 Tax=Chitinophaga ginsengisoli TaxID=363837 RepID=UPI001B7FF2FF|nr:hypothetical protein [Chitinophaga ginsengisoli]
MRTYLFQIIHIAIKIHLQRTNVVRSPIRYVRLTTCVIEMFVRIKLSHKKQQFHTIKLSNYVQSQSSVFWCPLLNKRSFRPYSGANFIHGYCNAAIHQ